MKWKSWKQAIILIGIAAIVAGCGNASVLETYSFGTVQLKVGSSELYMQSPFDLGRIQRKSDPGVLYGGEDKRMTIIALAEPKTATTVDQTIDNVVLALSQAEDISDLQMKSRQINIGNRSGRELICHYNQLRKDEKIRIVMQSLFFEDKDQVWHIQYVYRQGDNIGKEAIERVFGHIQ